jgi:hypothetical protein
LRGSFAGAADAAFGVGHDAVVEVEQSGATSGERKNDGGGIAAGIGDEARAGDLRAMQLRHAVDGLGLVRRPARAFILRSCRRRDWLLREPPCAAQVNDAHAARESFGHPLAGLLVRGGEKEDFTPRSAEQTPRRRAAA